jgi:hypothetical protein
MLQEGEGKNLDYNDRLSDQQEIKAFTNEIFSSGIAGITNNLMNLS